MIRHRRSLRGARTPAAVVRAVGAVLLMLGVVTCQDQPAGPSVVFGTLSVAPVFQTGGQFVGGNLPIDGVHAVVVRPSKPNPPLKDITVPFNLNTDQLQLKLQQIQLESPAESLDVTIELLSGTTIIFSGTQRLEAVAGPTPPPAPLLPLTFVGPGNSLTALFLAPLDSTLTQGDNLPMRVSGEDINQQAVPNFYVSWSTSDTNVARVNGDGVVTGKVPRGTVYVRARTPPTLVAPTGVVESTTVTLVPVPTAVLIVSGDGQNALAGQALPQPLVVRVVASDQQGVAGVTVDFVPPSGGSVLPASAVTDANGLAQTTATMPPSGAAQTTFTAQVTGLPAVSFVANFQAPPSHIWTGAVSTDWNVAGNWSAGTVPVSSDNVSIPAAPLNQPELISGNGTTGALVLDGTITMNGFSVTAFGNVTGSGSMVGGGTTGALVMPLAGTTLDLSTLSNVFISAVVTLGRTVNITGQLNIGGAGDLAFANHTANVSSSFSTTGTATITMTSPFDSLKVLGDVLFDGGSTFGKISTGVIFVRGNFTQAAASSSRSYAPTGNHLDVFTGTGIQTSTFATPGASASNFETLVLANTAGGVTLGSDIFQSGPVAFATGVPRIVHGGGHTVFVAELLASRVTLDNVLIVSNNVQITQFDSITFQNYSPSATPLTITHPGALTPFVFNDLVFQVTPTTGFYISVTDNAPADGLPLTMNMANPTPGTGTPFIQTSGGAVVNWPSGGPTPVNIWTGTVDTDWSTPGNWSTNAVPTFSDSVEIPAGGNQPILTTTSFAGAVHLANGTLTMGGQGLGVVNTFVVTGSGRLVMTDPNDALSIGGNAIFDGANELTFMSAGGLSVAGDLTQLATNSPDSYHPSGTHVTILAGNDQMVTFATPGLVPGSSHFQQVAWGGTGTLTLGSPVFAHSDWIVSTGTPTTIQGSSTLAVGGFFASGQPVTFDGVALEITNTGIGTIGLANVSFINQDPTGDQLTIHHSGASGSIITSNVSFGTVPTTGFYLVAEDNAPTDGLVLIIDMQNPTPNTPGGFVQTLGGAVVNWPAAGGGSATWTGAAANQDWNDPANWLGNAVPNPGDDVLIPASASSFPALISTEQVNNLVIEPGALIDFVDGFLDVTGDLTGGGSTTNGGPQMSGIGKVIQMADVGSLSVTGFVTLASNLQVTVGDLTISGPSAHFDVNGFSLTIANSLALLTDGRMQMTSPTGSVTVSGNAFFDGGSEVGLLTAGTLSVAGDFTQSNTTSQSSFSASGSHTVVLNGTGVQTVSVPDTALSNFRNLVINNTAGVVIDRLLQIQGNLTLGPGALVTADSPVLHHPGFNVFGNFATGTGSSVTALRLFIGGTTSVLGSYNVESTIYYGTGQTAPSSLPYQDLWIYGTVTMATGPLTVNNLIVAFPTSTMTLGDNTTVNGDVAIGTLGGGNLIVNSHTLTVVGALTTTGTGTLTMQNALDSVLVTGLAGFGGGSSAGMMTNGLLRVGASFSQTAGNSAASFAASGSHKTILGAAAVRVVNFATPGSGAAGSHFGNLDVTAASGGLTLLNDIVLDGTLISQPTGTAPTITGKKVTALSLGVTRASGTSLVLDNAPLVVDEQGTIRPQQFDRATFQGFAASATLMDLTLVGTALTPRAITFQAPLVQTSVTNLYAKLVSSNALGVTVTINGSNDPTGGPSKSDPPFGTTVNGATIIWQ